MRHATWRGGVVRGCRRAEIGAGPRRRPPVDAPPAQSSGISAAGKLAVMGLLALGGLPQVADAISGWRTAPTEGCRVVSVIDGDTVSMWCPGTGAERARLTGFDAPELFSPQCPAEAAKAAGRDLGLAHDALDGGRGHGAPAAAPTATGGRWSICAPTGCRWGGA
jgi:hypothetical protein